MEKTEIRLIKTLLLIFAFLLGAIAEKYTNGLHDPSVVHQKIESNGYQYCPYCGEKTGGLENARRIKALSILRRERDGDREKMGKSWHAIRIRGVLHM